MKTKTKKIKELNSQECQYICTQQDNDTCMGCPLYIINKGCYYNLKSLVESKGEKTITL